VWPQVGCPFAVRVEYAMPMVEGTVAKLQTRPGTDLDNYLYVMSVMGYVHVAYGILIFDNI
jgi:hypothetical protein